MRLGNKAEGGFAGSLMALMAVTVVLLFFVAMAANSSLFAKEDAPSMENIVSGKFAITEGKVMGDGKADMESYMEFYGYGAMTLEIKIVGTVKCQSFTQTIGPLGSVEGVEHSESGIVMLKDVHGRNLPAKYTVVAWR